MYLAGTFSQNYKGIHWLWMTKKKNGKMVNEFLSHRTELRALQLQVFLFSFFFFFPQITDTYTQHRDSTVRQWESFWVGERSNPKKGAPECVNSLSVSLLWAAELKRLLWSASPSWPPIRVRQFWLFWKEAKTKWKPLPQCLPNNSSTFLLPFSRKTQNMSSGPSPLRV